MNILLTILILYVVIGIVTGKVMFIVSIQTKMPYGIRFVAQWIACLMIGMFWLPIIAFIFYESKRKKI